MILENFFAEIVLNVSFEAVKYLAQRLAKGKIEFLIPDYFKYPIVQGRYHQNPYASKKGFTFHLSNNTKSPIMLSFFVFKCYWKSGSKQFSTFLEPKYYKKTIDAIDSGKIAKVTLPWKPVVISCLYASYLKEKNNADFFHLKINAYEDYKHEFYESEKLNDFFIRSFGLMNNPDLWKNITDEDLKKVGWKRAENLWVIKDFPKGSQSNT